ncbi:MAG: MBL fold metallo-hydrolase [Pseudomonadales bacterium]|jgi:beta-lactamase superfamily II metal-dependent hydrolase|nr:MBL fold metallo-hydrolase [Pseudomonadales bacterium]
MANRKNSTHSAVKFAVFFILISILIVASIFIFNSTPEGSDNVEISIFGIGRADAILITTNNYTIMIDAGENQHGQYLVDHLRDREITSIDYLIITHFDSDHVGGAHALINNLDVKKVIVPNYSRESRHVERFEAAMNDAELDPFVLIETMRLELDSVVFLINPSLLEYAHFSIGEDSGGDDFSIVVAITHGENNFLFTGDAEENRLEELLKNDEIMNLNYDFLKVPRHGRHNSRSIEFINVVSPRYAVITGFHPDSISYYYPERPADIRIIEALMLIDAEIFYTMSVGVLIRSDGDEISVTYSDFF